MRQLIITFAFLRLVIRGLTAYHGMQGACMYSEGFSGHWGRRCTARAVPGEEELSDFRRGRRSFAA
jgi:hypothetical protein